MKKYLIATALRRAKLGTSAFVTARQSATVETHGG